MITAKEWKAYNDGVAEISDKTEREVVKRLLAWNRLNPNASVAETREYAKLTMDSLVQSGGSLASSFAAKWYDYRAEQEHVKLDQAITATVYSPEKTDSVARYQAKKLVAGSFEEFAKACGEYARNDALRALNETIMANARRDRTKGVRFARVPTGHETCTFCLMLASRGAVYHSRQSAGEFRHFHRHCDCKVVPGFEDDPMAELVEGFKPKEMYKQWEKLKSIDEQDGLTTFERQLMKNKVVGIKGEIKKERGAHPWKKEYDLATLLSDLGVSVTFIKEKPSVKTPDAYLDGVIWEFKIPEAFNSKTIKNQIKSAVGKGTSNLVISNAHCPASDEEMKQAIRAFIANPGYKDEFTEIKRILFVGKEGSISEYKR